MALHCPLLFRCVAEGDEIEGGAPACPTETRKSSRDSVSLRAAALFAMLSAVLSACATTAVQRGVLRFTWPGLDIGSGSSQPIDALELKATSALPGEQLFVALSADEVRSVAQFVASKLGCTTKYVNLSTCFLSGAEAVTLKLPEKAAALAHLDSGLQPPKRIARVTVAHGDKSLAEGVGLYDVGPLDGRGHLDTDATVTLVKSLHWNYRPLQMDDTSANDAVTRALEPIRDLLLSTFGPIFPNLKKDYKPEAGTAAAWTGANVFSSSKRRSSRFWFNWFEDPREFQLSWLHTLPFNFDMSHEGSPETWKAVNISFCGQAFPTIEALAAADAKGQVWHCDGRQHTRYQRDVPGPGPGKAGKFPFLKNSDTKPQQTWKVSNGSVEWLDWKLIATVRPSTGLALYDIRFRDERVLYELALNDCHAYYAGPQREKQYHFSDKAYSMTQISGEMVEGLDCPEGATFIEGAIWIPFFNDGSSSSDPAVARDTKLACVFVSDGFEGSSWRHTQLINRKVSGRPLKFLVVRTVGTVGNYDYISEVRFGEDGSVNVREEFAGYPEIDRLFPRKQAPSADWGAVVHAQGEATGDLVQNLHSHYCVWKVDLDIVGLENEFYGTRVSHSQGSSEVYGQKIQETHRIDSEDPELELIASARTPGVWRVVNSKALNERSNAPRGYAIVMGKAPSVHTFQKPHPFALAATFARRHLAVTVRKEEEPEATSTLDFYAVSDPLYSVDGFLEDRESLVNKDLVCWVSVGKEHLARAEDQPLITNFGVDFSLLPWDYHAENPEMTLAMKGSSVDELLGNANLSP